MKKSGLELGHGKRVTQRGCDSKEKKLEEGGSENGNKGSVEGG